jgi:hypothetical protein
MGRGQQTTSANTQLLFGRRRGHGPSSSALAKTTLQHQLQMIDVDARSGDWSKIAERLGVLAPSDRLVGAERALLGLPTTILDLPITELFDETPVSSLTSAEELVAAIERRADISELHLGLPIALLGAEQPGPWAQRLAERIARWPQNKIFRSQYFSSGMTADLSTEALLHAERGPAWFQAINGLAAGQWQELRDDFRPLDEHFLDAIDGHDPQLKFSTHGHMLHITDDGQTALCGRSVNGASWKCAPRGSWQTAETDQQRPLCRNCLARGQEHPARLRSSSGRRFSDAELVPVAEELRQLLINLIEPSEELSWSWCDDLLRERYNQRLAEIAADRLLAFDHDQAWQRLLGPRYQEALKKGPLPTFDRQALVATFIRIGYLQHSAERNRMVDIWRNGQRLADDLRGIDPQRPGPPPAMTDWRRWKRAVRHSSNKLTAESHLFVADQGTSQAFTVIVACSDRDLCYDSHRRGHKPGTHRCLECQAIETATLG